MRFSVAIQPLKPLRTPTTAELARLPFAAEPKRANTEPAQPDELPTDLDQRVRLVGEW